MLTDPMRGRLASVRIDGLVMPAFAGIAISIATHHLTSLAALRAFFPTEVTAGCFFRWCFFGAVSHAVFSFSFLYRCRMRSRSMLLLSLLCACLLTTYILAFYLVRSHQTTSYASALAIYFILAFTYQIVRYKIRRAHLLKHQEIVMILGTGREAQKMWKHIRIECGGMVVFKGFVGESTTKDAAPDILARTVCTIDSLEQFLHYTVIDTLVLTANTPEDLAFVTKSIRIAQECGVRLLCTYEPYDDLPPAQRLQTVCESYVDFKRTNILIQAARTLKAAVDRVFAGGVLVLLMPLALPLLLLYRLILGGPVLVSQSVYGYRRRAFTMWNLRTATEDKQLLFCSASRRHSFANLRAECILRIGYFLQFSGLCRMPRLWNVCTGDMSMVGPTPVPREQAPLGNSSELLKRYTMRPGICWPEAEMEESIPSPTPLDNEATISYLKHWTLALDWKTFKHWLRSRSHRAIHAFSVPLMMSNTTLTRPTQRTR